MNRSENAPAVGDLLEARDLVGDRLQVDVFDVGLRLRRVLLALAHVRKAAHQIGDQFGEFLELPAAAALRHAGETCHALRHVGLEADALLLAVVADVDAGIHLRLHDVAHRLVHLGVSTFGS